MINNKGQAWGFDLIVAFILFLSGILIFYIYSLNISDQSEETLNTLLYDGNIIASSLLTEGLPKNWNSTNVLKIGILSNNKINQSKLESFSLIATNNFLKTKGIFNTRFNYYVYFPENITIDGVETAGIGLPPTSEKNLIKISRVTIYNNKPTTINIKIWE